MTAGQLAADFVIVGSGIAGLRAAIALQGHGRVLVLTKSDPAAGSTGYAQGGIAAAVGADDSPALHAADTIAAGDGLCDPQAVDVLVREGPRYVDELLEWGAAFDRLPDGRPHLTQEGAHAVRRVLHAADATGKEISRVLAGRLGGPPALTVVDHATVVQVMVTDGRARGVRFLDRDGRLLEAVASSVLLATGGAGQVFRDTTNPAVATGDGVALAYLAGAEVADLEFVQFHPTVLAVPGAPRFLLSEALRGEGARLINEQGEPFMRRYEAAGDLAPRDRVARAIVRESAETGRPVYLSLAHLPAAEVRARFPSLTGFCRRVGLDLATDRLPVGPAAHYFMGGVTSDLDGRTTLPGLFAAGEVACSGVHGANRLASNSLLEGLVFGGRAAHAMLAGDASRPGLALAGGLAADPPPTGATRTLPADESRLRELMWRDAGVFRDGAGLTHALQALDPAWTAVDEACAEGRGIDAASWRQSSLVIVSRLIVQGALARQESRGAHARADFPSRDDLHWKRRWPQRRTGAPSS